MRRQRGARAGPSPPHRPLLCVPADGLRLALQVRDQEACLAGAGMVWSAAGLVERIIGWGLIIVIMGGVTLWALLGVVRGTGGLKGHPHYPQVKEFIGLVQDGMAYTRGDRPYTRVPDADAPPPPPPPGGGGHQAGQARAAERKSLTSGSGRDKKKREKEKKQREKEKKDRERGRKGKRAKQRSPSRRGEASSQLALPPPPPPELPPTPPAPAPAWSAPPAGQMAAAQLAEIMAPAEAGGARMLSSGARETGVKVLMDESDLDARFVMR